MTSLPLSGIRILDLTQALAGPFSTMLLGDMGAEVIKVEAPKGEPTRSTPPYFVAGESLYNLSINRNKQGIVIDLKSEGGRQAFLDLVRVSDVVVYNFSPGVPERLGIDHETLLAVNDAIITCEVTGFGTRGPEAARKAVDIVVQSMGGGVSITGEEGRAPVRAGIPTADLGAGLFATIGILAALAGRPARNNRGMKVETSLFHSQISLLTYVGAFALYSNQAPKRVGSGHVGTVPSQVFETADGYLALEAGFDHHFKTLCAALGRPELAEDARFSVRTARRENRAVLVPLLEELFRSRPTAAWVEQLTAAGIACGPVQDVLEALASPQTAEYGLIKEFDVDGQAVKVVGSPLFFDGNLDYPVTPPPRLGEHTVPVLTRVLGYSPERVARLLQDRAVFTSNAGKGVHE